MINIKPVLTLIIFIFCFIFPLSAIAEENDSYALIIGIDYKDSGYDLSGAVSGAVLFEDFLKSKYNIQNVKTLYEKDATQDNIVKGLQELGKKVKPGDRVVIYYAGHGRQINDDNGDELDNLDDVLVPFDFDSDKNPKYINDDDINWLLSSINTNNMTVIFDSCHSGTANRAVDELDEFINQKHITRALPEQTGIKYKQIRPKSKNSNNEDEQNYIFLAAAMENEKAFDGSSQSAIKVRGAYHRCGSFSSALYKALNLNNSDDNWNDIWQDVVRMTMLDNPFQTPVFSGDQNKEAFKVTDISNENSNRYTTLKVKKVLDDGRVLVTPGEPVSTQWGSIYTSDSEALLKNAGPDETGMYTATKLLTGSVENGDMLYPLYQKFNPILPPLYVLSKDNEIKEYLEQNLKQVAIVSDNSEERYYSNIINVRDKDDEYRAYFKYKPVNLRKSETFKYKKGLLNWTQKKLNNIYNFLNIINLYNPYSELKYNLTFDRPLDKPFSITDKLKISVKADKNLYVNVIRIDSAFGLSLIKKDIPLKSNQNKDIIISFQNNNYSKKINREILKVILSRKPLVLPQTITADNLVSALIALDSNADKAIETKGLIPLKNWSEELFVYSVMK